MPSTEVTARSATTVVGAPVAHHARPCAPATAPRTPARFRRRGRPCGSRRDRCASALRRIVELLARHGAGAADGEARPGKRVAADERARGRPSSRPSARTSSLNSSRSGSTSFMLHALGQAADVVVALDRRRGTAGERHALDHVGIERALRQELDRSLAVGGDAARLGLERIDEELADRLAFGFRVVERLRARSKKCFGRVNMDERNVEMAAEQARPPRPLRPAASGRDRRRRRSADRRPPRGSAPPPPPNRRRPRGRR